MTTSTRRDVFLLIVAAAIFALLYWFAQTETVRARSQAACWFSEGYLYATGLPTTYPVGVTLDPYPVGIGTGIPVNPDGTWSREADWASAYFWVRGHGPSLRKPGPGLNDFHVIAECFA